MQLLTEPQCSQYRDVGYVVVPRLFEPDITRQMIAHYMAARGRGPLPGDYGGTSDHPEDPTHRYPRMINMHDRDPLSEQWATAAKLQSIVRQTDRRRTGAAPDHDLLQAAAGTRPGAAPGRAIHYRRAADRCLGSPRPIGRAGWSNDSHTRIAQVGADAGGGSGYRRFRLPTCNRCGRTMPKPSA